MFPGLPGTLFPESLQETGSTELSQSIASRTGVFPTVPMKKHFGSLPGFLGLAALVVVR